MGFVLNGGPLFEAAEFAGAGFLGQSFAGGIEGAVGLSSFTAVDFDAFVQSLVEVGHQCRAAVGAEFDAAGDFAEVVFLHAASGEEQDAGSLGNDAKRFDHVKDQGPFVVVVRMQKADKGIQSRENQRAFDLGIQHAIGIVQRGVERICRRLAAAGFKAVFLRQQFTETGEIGASGLRFDCHDGATSFVDGARDLGQFGERGGDRRDPFFGRFRLIAPAFQFAEKCELVGDFGLDPLTHDLQAVVLVSGFDLAATDRGGAAQLGLPDARDRLAGTIKKDHVDVVFGSQMDDVAGKVHAGGDNDALHFLGRKGDLFVSRFDEKPVALAAQAGSACVDD